MMRLIGYINPVDRFPAVVVPILIDESDNLFGVFNCRVSAQGFSRQLRGIRPDSGIYKFPDNWSDKTILKLAPTDICVLALSKENPVAYSVADERQVLSTFLADPSFASDQPFTRLAISKLTGSIHLVIAELLSAALHLLTLEASSLGGGSKARMELWIQQERESIAEQLSSSPEISRFLDDFPTSLEELGKLTWWRGHLALRPTQALFTLQQIEDRKPSPKTAAILNIEPQVPDGLMLAIMGRHLLAGTNYLFFHARSASEKSVQELRDATDQAVRKARDAATGPLGSLTSPLVGSVKFYELNREWTGSPFVFYEDTSEGTTKVVGYRGVDIGVSIASCYEKLPDQFAIELLEALTSSAPVLHDFESGHSGRSIIPIRREGA